MARVSGPSQGRSSHVQDLAISPEQRRRTYATWHDRERCEDTRCSQARSIRPALGHEARQCIVFTCVRLAGNVQMIWRLQRLWLRTTSLMLSRVRKQIGPYVYVPFRCPWCWWSTAKCATQFGQHFCGRCKKQYSVFFMHPQVYEKLKEL